MTTEHTGITGNDTDETPAGSGPDLTGPQHYKRSDATDTEGEGVADGYDEDGNDPNDPAVSGVGAKQGVSGSSDAGVSDEVADAGTPASTQKAAPTRRQK